MIQNEVFIWGSGLLSHPVTYLFHMEESITASDPATLAHKRVIIVDCRVSGLAATAEAVDAGLAHRKPVVLLCPSEDSLKALEGHVALRPQVAAAAVLIHARPAEHGAGIDIWALEYSAAHHSHLSAEGPSRAAEAHKSPHGPQAPVGCACSDAEDLLRAFTTAEAVNAFKMEVERLMDDRPITRLTVDPPPTGVVYFLDTFNSIVPFTYSGGGVSNGPGSATFTWTVWGFLSQTATSNLQYLIVEGRISVSSGGMHKNDQCDRGFGNTYVQGTLSPPGSMGPQAFVPVSGNGRFQGAVTIPISYKSPLGGYQIWNFSTSVDNSVDSWSCKSISTGSALGAQWWMNTPCDGSNVADKWKDAFSFWGHVNDFTGASTGSVDVNTVSAWVTPSLLNGYQAVTGNFSWQGARFFGSSCSPGMYWAINAGWQWFYNWNPGFTVNFARIFPT
jgi:hypothetical protein